MKFKLSVSAAVSIIVALAIIVLLTLSSISLMTHTKRDEMVELDHRFEQLLSSAEQVNAEFLIARGHEKDFLLNKDMRHVERHSQTLARMQETLDFAATFLAANPEFTESTDLLASLNQTMQEYSTSFQDLVNLHQTLGLNSDQGLQHAVNTAALTVERIASNSGTSMLTSSLSKMRHLEKEFVLAPSESIAQAFNDEATAFKDLPFEYYYDYTRKGPLNEAIDVYVAAFADYVSSRFFAQEKEQEVAQHFATAQPLILAIKGRVFDQLDAIHLATIDLGATSKMRTMVAGLIGALVFTVSAFLFARGVASPLRGIESALEKLMRDDLDIQMPISRFRELSVVCTAMQSALDEERAKADILREIHSVIDACTEGDFSHRITIANSQ